MSRIVVLGAGLISPPLLRYLLDHTEHHVCVGSDDVPRARRLVGDHPRGAVMTLDVTDAQALSAAIAEADLVVSLLPAPLTPRAAKVAIETRTPLVNTSYAGPEIRALDGAARDAGVLLLAECGADPGLDHMSAVRLLRRIEAEGGILAGFSSCAGGLPARDDANNPWGYKFSWSPRAALVASTRSARYLEDDRVVEVPGDEIFGYARPYEIEGLGRFEVYPNSDALVYRELYGLDGARDLFRGTLRYPGWAAAMQAAHDLDLLDIEAREWPTGTTYAQWLSRRLPEGSGSLPERVARHLGCDPDEDVVRRFEWAGLLSDRPIPERRVSSLDLLAGRLAKLMVYDEGESDMVVLEHRIRATDRDGHPAVWCSRLLVYGSPPDDSAMGRCAALPAAVAADRILAGEISGRGLEIPIRPDVYEPILHGLEPLGIRFDESCDASGN